MTDEKFFGTPKTVTLAQLAEKIPGLQVPSGKENQVIDRIDIPKDASPASLSFHYIPDTHKEGKAPMPEAGACIVTEQVARLLPPGVTPLISKNPKLDFIKAVNFLFKDAKPEVPATYNQIDPTAQVAKTAVVEQGAVIEAGAIVDHYAVIKAGAHIGKGAKIGSHTTIGTNVEIGDGSSVGNHSNVEYAKIGRKVNIASAVNIGADDFNYGINLQAMEALHFPHMGRVIIKDGADIGANSHVQRGVIGDTVISELCKIGPGCNISHNVQLGLGNGIYTGATLLGSVTTGKLVTVYADAIIRDQINVGDGATVGMRSNVVKDVAPGQKIMGNPARQAGKRGIMEILDESGARGFGNSTFRG